MGWPSKAREIKRVAMANGSVGSQWQVRWGSIVNCKL